MTTESTAEYTTIGLGPDPIANLSSWLAEAIEKKVPEPTAMALATATAAGSPSVRIVLFKDLSRPFSDGRRAPRFFTNYDGRKSKELLANPHVALCFFWPTLGRQIRIEGKIERISPEESNKYFQSRPRGSRIGAWASPQSQKIGSRAELLALVAKVEEQYKDQEIPCPPYWGGWCVVPARIEFWQAGEFRLHDRFLYEWSAGRWTVSRLAP